MALASQTFAIDFSVLGDANPYTNALITNLNGSAQIASGVFRPNTLNSIPQRFIYSGAVSGDTMRVSARVAAGGNYNEWGIGFINASGNGYWVRYTWANTFSIYRIDGDTPTLISDQEDATAGGLSVDALFHLDITLSTGYIEASYEDPNGTPAVNTPTTFGVFCTDTTYGAGAGLKPAMIFDNEDGSFLLKAWGADAGASATIEQEGYRFRADDGSETGANWLASQDTNISREISLATRIRMVLNGTEDPAAAQFRLDYKLSSASLWRAVEALSGSNPAFGTIGAVTTTGTTAPTVAYPASIAEGDLLVLAIANRPNASTPATPSGWTAHSNYTATGGAGSEAAGTGTVRITVFTKEAVGTESGTLALSITSGTSCGAVMWRLPKIAGKQWDVALVNGSDNTAGTTWSVTFGADPGVAANDLVFVASASSEDTATFASQALTQAGVTYGTMVERADTAIATGNDLRIIVSEHPITSGTSSAAATYTMTASSTNAANSAGASIMIRARAVSQPILLNASSNITASGENTTAQLTAPSGKTTGDFVAGRIQDDENPADSVDIGADQYTEMEWSIIASSTAQVDDVYQFRVTNNGTALNTYTVTPEWTIAATGTPGNASGDGVTDTASAPAGSAAEVSEGVSITNISDATLTHGQTGITITGTGFGASQGTGRVVISPTDNIADGGAIDQTVTAWGASSITFTAVLSSFSFGTLYVFVENDGDESNASGEAVSRVVGSVTLTFTGANKFIDEDGNPVQASGLTLYVWRAPRPPSSVGTPDQILTALATDSSGELTQAIDQGSLAAGDSIYGMLFAADGTDLFWAGERTPVYA